MIKQNIIRHLIFQDANGAIWKLDLSFSNIVSCLFFLLFLIFIIKIFVILT